MSRLTVVKTEIANFESTHSLGRAFRNADPKNFWPRPYPGENEQPEEYVARLIKGETAPEPPFVKETMFWGLVDGIIVGRISVRHELNERLAKFGGHIGYEVHPEHRRKGYATQMLKLTLQTAIAKEVGRLLLTCAPNNYASNKTILSNGGVLEKMAYVDFLGEDRNYYWINLS